MTQPASPILEPATVPEALDRAATTRAGITVIDRHLAERHIAYRDLRDAAARAATALRSLGIGPGDRVCLLSPTTPELLVALYGTWWAGAVPVILPLPRRQNELEAFFQDVLVRTSAADARVLVASQLFIDAAPGAVPGVTLAAVEDVATGDQAASPLPCVRPEDLAFLQFTSGTTARSRAVALHHEHLLTNMQAAGRAAQVDPDHDVIVSWLPLFHDMGLIGMLLGSVIFSIDLVLEPTEEFLARPGSWVDAISRYRGTITAAPNFGYGLACRDLAAKPRALDLSSWRLAANGAEPIDVDTVGRFVDLASPYGFREEAMCPMFGLAEATLAVSLARPDEPVQIQHVSRELLENAGEAKPAPPGDPGTRALVSCGWPVPGHDIAILSPGGDPLPPGGVGEICVRGPSVMAGYWRDAEGTAEALRCGWLHTGDLGFLGPTGLVVCGRLKDMIILGGRNLYPEDYEFWTESVPGVRRGNVIAFSIPDRERMVVVAETTVSPDEAELVGRQTIEVLRQKLQRGPEEVVLVSPGTLPKTSSGKRQRGACRDRYTTGQLEPVVVVRRT